MPTSTSDTPKINLLNLSWEEIHALFVRLGEPAYRAKQLIKWIYQVGVDDFSLMTNFSKTLRNKLSEIAEICPPEVVWEHASPDGTQKWVLKLDSKNQIETVFIPDKQRGTLCVSSQVGCTLDCSFCATGKQGFQRNLSLAEVMGQVWLAAKQLQEDNTPQRRKITNIVFMGMGEPLLNFNVVMHALKFLTDDNAYGLSKRRVTVSTAGVVPMIDQLEKYTDVSLALSLHAPNDMLRNELVPLNKKYPITEVIAACKRYLASLPDRRSITIEYVMLDQINDADLHAKQLTKVLAKLPCKINLIPFNPFPNTPYQRSKKERILAFQQQLAKAGFVTTVRSTRGDEIAAACGQLVGQVNDRTNRQKRYQNAIAVANV